MALNGADVDQFEPLPSTSARCRINARIPIIGLLGWMRWDRLPGQGHAASNEFFEINSSFSVHSLHLWHSYGVGRLRKRDLDMLKRSFRIYGLSLAGGALLLGGGSVAAAMPLPPPEVVTAQSPAAIFTDGADAAKVEQIYWRAHGGGWHGHGGGWHGHGYGWHGHGWHGGGWHGHGYGWHGGGYGWRRSRWCYWHPYAC
jgi:hypothetical protein